MQKKIDLIIFKNSKFRAGQKLNKSDLTKLHVFSNEKLTLDAIEIITKRLAPAVIGNDGKQTPFKGHPVFIAQHATATCCRECLVKWHQIEKNKELNSTEIEYILSFILLWLKDYKENSLKSAIKETKETQLSLRFI